MNLDMHCHTVASDGVNRVEELIENAKAKGLEALFVTDHDVVSNSDVIESIRFAGMRTAHSVEISTTNTQGDNKGLHMTYYTNSVSDELLGILQNTREQKLKTIGEQLIHLQEKGFYVDSDEFYAGVKWEGISNYDIARYIASKSENEGKLREMGCMDSQKPHSDFYRKCLRRGGKLYTEYSISREENYKPELGDISEMTQGQGILSIAHPNYTFSHDHITGFRKLYKEVYKPQLGINAIEINTKASKNWVNAILDMKEYYGVELQLTFGSDCHRLEKPDDKHGDLGFENSFLDEKVVKREFGAFREKLGI